MSQYISINSKDWVIEEGGLWEDKQFSITSNMEVSTFDRSDDKPCKHCHSPHKVIHTRSWDDSEWEEYVWICPFVVTATNEGGCNSTGICLNCLIDGIADNKINLNVSISINEEIKIIHEISSELLRNNGWVDKTEEDWCMVNGNNKINYIASEGWILNGEIVRSMEEIKQKMI